MTAVTRNNEQLYFLPLTLIDFYLFEMNCDNKIYDEMRFKFTALGYSFSSNLRLRLSKIQYCDIHVSEVIFIEMN